MDKISYSTITYKDKRILMRKFHGSTTYYDIIKSWEYCKSSNLVTDELQGVISDYREAKISDHHSHFEQLLDYFNKHPELASLKMAAIVNNPEQSFFNQCGLFAFQSIDLTAFKLEDEALDWLSGYEEKKPSN